MKDALSSPHQLRATRVIAATAGVLCGISGLEHGFFETLQGATAPGDLMIDRDWPGAAVLAGRHGDSPHDRSQLPCYGHPRHACRARR